MIYHKSSHPVEVKKVSIRLWSLRDEIEAAIERRIRECEAAAIPLYIDDIKAFYNLNPDIKLTDNSNVLPMPVKEDGVTALMESLGDENKGDAQPEESTPAAAPEEAIADAATTTEQTEQTGAQSESETFKEAEGILAEQESKGIESKKPNPILDRPFQRQAPNSEKISYGFSFLADINMKHLLSFTKNKFIQGQTVVVEFLIPQSFMMTAEVSYCHHYARTSKIISSTKPDYRVQCRFIYAIRGERDSLRNFLISVEPNLGVQQKKAPKASEDDSLGL